MNLTALLRLVPELLFVVGVVLVSVGLWFASWQAGLVGTGLLLIAAAIAIRGAIRNAAEKRRR